MTKETSKENERSNYWDDRIPGLFVFLLFVFLMWIGYKLGNY